MDDRTAAQRRGHGRIPLEITDQTRDLVTDHRAPAPAPAPFDVVVRRLGEQLGVR